MLCDPLSASCLGWECSHRPQFIEGIKAEGGHMEEVGV